jgi:hypothetical protein
VWGRGDSRVAAAALPEAIQDLLLGSRDAPVPAEKQESLRRFLDAGLAELHTTQIDLTSPLPSSDKIHEAIDLFALNRRAGFFCIRELVAPIISKVYRTLTPRPEPDRALRNKVGDLKLKIPGSIYASMNAAVEYGNAGVHQPIRNGYFEFISCLAALIAIIEWYPTWENSLDGPGSWERLHQFSRAGEKIIEICQISREVIFADDGLQHYTPGDEFWIRIHTGTLMPDNNHSKLFVAVLLVDQNVAQCLKPRKPIAPARILEIPLAQIPIGGEPLRFGSTLGRHCLYLLITKNNLPEEIYLKFSQTQPRNFLDNIARHIQRLPSDEWELFHLEFAIG